MSEEQLKIKNCVNHLFNSDSNNYIFIYTPPKVGSTTLVTSLRVSLGKSYNIIHIHDEIMLSVLTKINEIKVNDIIKYLVTIGKKVYVIDVYRTPVERKMSEFFEKIAPYHFNNTEENITHYSIKRITERFNKIFPYIENSDHYFDKFDIENPINFDFEKKYTIQNINNINYIKLRLCDSHIWSYILSSIFTTDIIIIKDYQTDSKKIGELYKKFKTKYILPCNFIDNIENCKYLKFYYNEEERKQYLETWKNKLDTPFIPYTKDQFNFYIQICLENQYINDIQTEHYIDNGCFCKYCSLKRKDIYFRAKNGETNFEKIIHMDSICTFKEEKNHDIINKSNKFRPNQFAIQLKL